MDPKKMYLWCYLVATIRDGLPQVAIVPLPLRTGTAAVHVFFHRDVYCTTVACVVTMGYH